MSCHGNGTQHASTADPQPTSTSKPGTCPCPCTCVRRVGAQWRRGTARRQAGEMHPPRVRTRAQNEKGSVQNKAKLAASARKLGNGQGRISTLSEQLLWRSDHHLTRAHIETKRKRTGRALTSTLVSSSPTTNLQHVTRAGSRSWVVDQFGHLLCPTALPLPDPCSLPNFYCTSTGTKVVGVLHCTVHCSTIVLVQY
jgi:hypothetical protein